MNLLIGFFLALTPCLTQAQGANGLVFTTNSPVLIFADANRQIGPMDSQLMKFISDTLYSSKPSSNLICDLKINEIKQERKFSDGVRTIEMLEVIYFTRSYMNVPDQKIYFPLNTTTIIRSEINSRLAGLVEEIEMKANDRLNSRFIFQHNGNGEIIWMTFEDDMKTVPCRLRN